jgi:hypothetical protein
MADSDRHAVEANANLSRSRDLQVGLRWPEAVSSRLDDLVDLASTVGERTNRKELSAALVATCALTADQLSEAIRRYRTMQVRDITDGSDVVDGVIYMDTHRSGPRRRKIH